MLRGAIDFRLKGRSPSIGGKQELQQSIEPEVLVTENLESRDSWDRADRERDIRQGIDLATTLERIEKNFVISDPRLPDNPIVSLVVVLWILLVPYCDLKL